jgi:hypothetical protein
MRANHAMVGAAAVLACAAYAVTMAAPIPPMRTELVVHEWGTFSTFSGSDGVPAKFYPNGLGDLPHFVHSYLPFSKGKSPTLVSLETPVLYFYTDQPLTATVRADFPTGVFTEWFPQASQPVGKTLTWASPNSGRSGRAK